MHAGAGKKAYREGKQVRDSLQKFTRLLCGGPHLPALRKHYIVKWREETAFLFT
jgi:hypothetical protein